MSSASFKRSSETGSKVMWIGPVGIMDLALRISALLFRGGQW